MAPYDQNYDDDDKDAAKEMGSKRSYTDFDCPSCNANNPVEGIKDQDELLCNYCGTEFKASITDEGRLRLKEM